MRGIKYFLQHVHSLWSVPLMFFAYYMVGLLLAALFGYGTGAYDPAFIQPLFLAGAVVLGIANFALLILFFTFKGLYRYLYGKKVKGAAEGLKFTNKSKEDWEGLTIWQKFILAFSVFFLFFVAVTLVYLKMV